jgi:Fe-S-cluster containining protein
MAFSSDPQKWSEEIVKKMNELPFECVNILGEGANCSVHSIRPRTNSEEEEGRSGEDCEEEEEESKNPHEDWVDKYFNLNDIVVTPDEPSESDMEYESDSGDYSSHEDETSEEWSDVRPDGTTQTASHECFMTESPMGTVEVVAKKFYDLKEDVCYEGTNPVTHKTTLESNPERYMEWITSQKEAVETSVLKERITLTSARFSEFVNESLCHILLTDLVAKHLTPHLVMAFRSLECENVGYLLQERIDSTLEETLERDPQIDSRGLASLYLQIFVTLHILQETCGFKHHDLHTDNIFIKKISPTMVWKGERMDQATHFQYILGNGVTLCIPNIGYIVKIGDFGIGSMDAFGRRIQRLDMGTHARQPRWGPWDAKLTNCRGYDGQVLMGVPPFDDVSWRFKDKNTKVIMKRLRVAAQGLNGKLSASKHRPLEGHVSDVPPLDVIQQVFVDNPLVFANFTVTPLEESNPKVITLTNMTELSSATPLKPPKRRRRRKTSTNSSNDGLTCVNLE